MQNEAQIKSVALFFFYTCMDEGTILHSTAKILEKNRKQLNEGGSAIVASTHDAWKKWQESSIGTQISVGTSDGWVLDKNADFGVWQDFRKSADQDEFLAVIWSKLLKLTDDEIAIGLGVSVGTVRHRVGRGLRHLGQIRKVTKKKKEK